MRKSEAVEQWAARDLHNLPSEWVQIVAEAKGEEHRWPMWGTMFLVDHWMGKHLEEHCHTVTPEEDMEMEGEQRIGKTARISTRLTAGS